MVCTIPTVDNKIDKAEMILEYTIEKFTGNMENGTQLTMGSTDYLKLWVQVRSCRRTSSKFKQYYTIGDWMYHCPSPTKFTEFFTNSIM